MRNANILSGVILIVFGGAMLLFIIPAQIEEGPEGMMSPRLVPQMMMALIMGLSLLLVLSNLRAAPEPDAAPPFTRPELIASAALLGLFAAAVALFLTVGVLAASVVLVVGALLILGERRPATLVLMPLCLIGGAYLLFYRLLGTAIL
jgi:hypothetical protein